MYYKVQTNVLLMIMMTYFAVIQVPMYMGILLVTVKKAKGQGKGGRRAAHIVQQYELLSKK